MDDLGGDALGFSPVPLAVAVGTPPQRFLDFLQLLA
jgi:hypothetical protein